MPKLKCPPGFYVYRTKDGRRYIEKEWIKKVKVVTPFTRIENWFEDRVAEVAPKVMKYLWERVCGLFLGMALGYAFFVAYSNRITPV